MRVGPPPSRAPPGGSRSPRGSGSGGGAEARPREKPPPPMKAPNPAVPHRRYGAALGSSREKRPEKKTAKPKISRKRKRFSVRSRRSSASQWSLQKALRRRPPGQKPLPGHDSVVEPGPPEGQKGPHKAHGNYEAGGDELEGVAAFHAVQSDDPRKNEQGGPRHRQGRPSFKAPLFETPCGPSRRALRSPPSLSGRTPPAG